MGKDITYTCDRCSKNKLKRYFRLRIVGMSDSYNEYYMCKACKDKVFDFINNK